MGRKQVWMTRKEQWPLPGLNPTFNLRKFQDSFSNKRPGAEVEG